MIILPAIDLKDGRCVRLRQGRADDATVYSDDPVEMAKRWVDEGGEYLHVVDLDGAFTGAPAHLEVIARIASAISIPMEVGGGLRTDDDVRRLLDAGVDRAIIGTRAFADPDSLAQTVQQFGEHVAVGIDARDGRVQVKGWVETTDMLAVDLARKADAVGVRTLIVTDTATDGMMVGTNVAAMDEICKAVTCNVIASGGVTTPDDVRDLTALQHANLYGAIVGKALYEEATSLREMKAACVA
ncbi:MAG: 1-(5-phosphoribosyl)-5-[(5-phosphoribosylamino)methylideneamino]imidazole-4-carboxamide isomerase [Verrucomicrobia bacterium]|jgi:phosphoribosylformimino-5-aminoimidazole carboxamide ribotide isomerase|nr:1-(5-phosphoribosyl)-5-[(5-phosphoribosylamino)methylideneamino]imidazole-4-carboxamide isomerase [Verrucomicrobiota bacterium]